VIHVGDARCQGDPEEETSPLSPSLRSLHRRWKRLSVSAAMLFLFGIACLFTGNLIATGQQGIALLMAMAVPIAVVVLSSRIAPFYVIAIALFSLNSLSGWGMLPQQVTWVIDFVILLAVGKALFLWQRGEAGLPPTSLNLVVLGLAVVGAISVIVNGVAMPVVAAGVRHHFKYILMLYALCALKPDPSALRRLIWLLIGLAFLQTPVAVAQRVLLGIDDLVAGTLGYNANQELSLFLIGVACVLVGLFLQRYKMQGKLYLMTMPLLLAPIALNQAKAAFLYLPVALGAVVVMGKRRRSWRALGLVLFLTAMVAALLFTADRVITRLQISEFLTDTDAMLGEFVETGDQGHSLIGYSKNGTFLRGSAVVYAHSEIVRSPVTALIGVGPGNASESFFGGSSGEYWDNREPDKIQLSKTLFEFGYLGLLLFLVLHFLCFGEVLRMRFDDSFWRGVAIGFAGILVMYVLGILYAPVWASDVLGFLFWFTAGALFLVGARRNSTGRHKVYATIRGGSEKP